LAIGGEGAVGILADLIGDVEEDAGDVVGLAFRGGSGGGGLVLAEVEGSGGGVDVALQEIVADAADIDACFEGVVAEDLGPVVGEVDVRFSAEPGQGLRVADERVAGAVFAVACEVADLEGDLAAVDGAEVGAGNAEGLGVGRTEVGLLGGVAEVGYADADLGEEGGGEDMVVVEAGAVGGCFACGFEAAASRAAEEGAKERGLIGGGGLMAEAAAEMILLGDGVVGLDVVADGVFAEGRVLREVVGGFAGDIGGGGEIGGGVAGKGEFC